LVLHDPLPVLFSLSFNNFDGTLMHEEGGNTGASAAQRPRAAAL
jgi:hypothetical protein